MNKILIIEDNIEIAEMERDFLEASDFAVTITTDGEAGLAALADGDYALVLLDIMLPGRDGFAICRDIRAKSEVPVLIVSARGEDIDKIRGLGLGADDYITKPFSPGELIARVKSHISPASSFPRNSCSSASGASTPSAIRRPSWYTSIASAAASSPIPRIPSTSRPSGGQGIDSENRKQNIPQEHAPLRHF